MPRKTSEWIESFQIFDKYGCEGVIAAGHDEIYAGPDPELIEPADRARLEALGWQPWDTGNFRTSV